ncbi:MAG: DUF2752 domain-containing protein [Anaeromyxobacter sp.]
MATGEATTTATHRTFGHAEVFASIALMSFAVARFFPVLSVPYVCPSKALFHLPCPTCGMTHAFVALAHGDLAGAFLSSPAGTLLAAGAWALAVADLVRLALGAPLPALSPRTARLLVAAGVAAGLASWVFVLAREIAR